MTTPYALPFLATGVRNLDALLGGGLSEAALTILAGPPGSGKTILAQQIAFHVAAQGGTVLYLSTLSEPTAKTLRYLRTLSFFDAKLFDSKVKFVDLGEMLRTEGLAKASSLIVAQLEAIDPALLVIDSFKVFDDLAKSSEELRKFAYEIAVNLMAWECTALLLGEYGPADYETNPLFSIADGLVRMSQRTVYGEHQRFIQVVKMRGTAHVRDEQPFIVSAAGIDVLASRLTIGREAAGEGQTTRCMTGITRLDELLGEGIPRGSSILVGGVAGTGKTVLLLEFIYRGATEYGEQGIFFSFEETEDRLRATARGLGWDLDAQIASGMIEIVFIPQPDILVEQHLLMMNERMTRTNARRVAIDSVSVFLHKVGDAEHIRDKIFQLASLVQNGGRVGLFATDIPYGSTHLSRFGVEETVVDGVILLSSREQGVERERYIEVYKLRNTAHRKGRHTLVIGEGGIRVFPRTTDHAVLAAPPPPLDATRRLSVGIPKLDALLGGGLLERSVTLVSGSAGIGKSTLGIQFVLAGAERKEPCLYVALEEGPAQLMNSADSLGLPLRDAVDRGLVSLLYLSREEIRAAQLPSRLMEAARSGGTRRLVLDSASQIESEGLSPRELRQLLYELSVSLKSLSVTSLITLESENLYDTDSLTDRGLSPIADNIVMLRYARSHGHLERVVTVVKTRGSAHEAGTFGFQIGPGGILLGDRTSIAR